MAETGDQGPDPRRIALGQPISADQPTRRIRCPSHLSRPEHSQLNLERVRQVSSGTKAAKVRASASVRWRWYVMPVSRLVRPIENRAVPAPKSA